MRPTALILSALCLSACQAGGSADIGTIPSNATSTATGTATGTSTGTATGSTTTPTGCQGLELLGCGSHSVAGLVVDEVLNGDDGLRVPRDLEFHPYADELWIVNQWDDSLVIAVGAGTDKMVDWKLVDGDNQAHFMAQPSGLAFNRDDGTWASIHETDEQTQGPWGTPFDFMGPTLWTGDSSIMDGGALSHLDMLHNSPNGVGIAWESANIYWVYDGYNLSLTRYDFADDHDLGGTDHSDGRVTRYASGQMGYEPEVSSHVVYDASTGLVYAADTANNQIVVLDPSTASNGGPYGPDFDGGTQTEMVGATLTVLVEGSDFGMVAPSGMEEWDGLLYVSDNETGRIHAFDKQGQQVDYLETGAVAGALMGMEFDPRDGSLWIVDAATHVVRHLYVNPAVAR